MRPGKILLRLSDEPAAWDPTLVRETVDLLCKAATHPDFAKQGQQAIFSLVERLSDAFEPSYVRIYDEIFAQVIDYCRRHPSGIELNRTLDGFGIHSERDLIARKDRLSSPSRFVNSHLTRVKKAIVLSRVTLGADVAVTSVVVRSLRQVCPNAEIVTAGPASMGQIFEGEPRVRVARVDYRKGTNLMDRLSSWIDLVRLVDTECRGLDSNEYLIVDPDSRLTQLGLLPVAGDNAPYCFFDSRSYRDPEKKHISDLTAQWCRETFGSDANTPPFLRISSEERRFGADVASRLRGDGPARVVALNFGVGENEKKRLSLAFETQLVKALLRQGNRVILDKGVGAEVDGVNRLLSDVQSNEAELVTWQGSVGGFAGLIASSDLYVGYDSAFQHIASALGVPVVDIFVQPEREVFVDRWTPSSRATEMVVRDAGRASDVIQSILAIARR